MQFKEETAPFPGLIGQPMAADYHRKPLGDDRSPGLRHGLEAEGGCIERLDGDRTKLCCVERKLSVAMRRFSLAQPKAFS